MVLLVAPSNQRNGGKILDPIVVDCRGLTCPQPVVRTKKALDELERGELVTIVDNPTSRDNVVKFARSQDYPVEVEERNGEFYIRIQKEFSGSSTQVAPVAKQVMLISSFTLGRPEEELGQVLMRSFFYTLREAEVVPGSIIFINSGVKLACEGSPVLSDLMALEKRGVKILSCGTCLDYFQLKEKLCVGSISNMYSIVEAMMTSDRLITLG